MSNIKMQLSCPMPTMDHDRITLGHGGGGTLTNKLLQEGVFTILRNDLLDVHHDGAVFQMEGPIAFTTDSFVISPIFFPGGDIGELAINGTVNDLAMCGAIPEYLSLSFIIEEGMLMKDFWEVLYSIKHACQQANVKIVTGDTKVVERGKGDQLFINTTGVGKVHPNAQIGVNRIEEGDVVIVSDVVASHGISIMSVREGLEFETDILSDTRPLNHMVNDLLNQYGDRIRLLKDPTRGGLASVLNEVGRDTGMGIQLNEKKIPIASQVKGACEILGLDPLYVANEGIFIAIVAAKVAEQVVASLHKNEFSKHAAIIGEVTSEHPQKVVMKSGIGGKRVVNMLVGEQLPRIC
jgi:hydrogenase expression/formation protein HypE